MSLGKAVLTGLARLFGVSFVELAADREGAGRQLAEAAASAADADTIDAVFADLVSPDALELDRRELEDAATDAFELLASAARPVADTPDAQDQALSEYARALGREPSEALWRPFDTIERLEDAPDLTYVWLLHDGEDAAAWADRIDELYREQFGREPAALHVPVTGVEQIKRADPGEIRTYVEPHIQRAENGGD